MILRVGRRLGQRTMRKPRHCTIPWSRAREARCDSYATSGGNRVGCQGVLRSHLMSVGPAHRRDSRLGVRTIFRQAGALRGRWGQRDGGEKRDGTPWYWCTFFTDESKSVRYGVMLWGRLLSRRFWTLKFAPSGHEGEACKSHFSHFSIWNLL